MHQNTFPAAFPLITHSSSRQFYFDGFVFIVDEDALVELASGQRHKLEPQVAAMLLLMVEHQGQVLSKESIQQQLWPNTVVETNSLYQPLAKLRKLLNDSSKSPKFIKTLPKKGYCFIASVEVACANENDNGTSHSDTVQPRRLWFGLSTVILLVSFVIIVSFFKEKTTEPPQYKIHDISYQLGLEFDVAVHRQHDLMAYIKDIHNLHITNKAGDIKFQVPSDYRVAFPVWHPEQTTLAYWRYREDKCDLILANAQGQTLQQAPALTCESARAPVWKNNEQLIVSIKKGHQFTPQLYDVKTNQFSQVIVKKPSHSHYKGVVKAWDQQVYYLINHRDHTSTLVSETGNAVMKWDYPIWLAAFNPATKAVITNNESQRHGLMAKTLDGGQYQVSYTAQGLYTSLSIDNAGDIFTSVESWQVNIRDQQQDPIFSTSSIDYLPVSNRVGETAFMSRRSGICEVYLHANDQVTRLSHHQGYEYVSFLEWRPDLSMLLSNRDMNLVIYNRNSVVNELSTTFSQPIINIGWLSNEHFFAFDGTQLATYNIQGQLLSITDINARFVYFDLVNQQWLTLVDNTLYSAETLQGSTQTLASLTPEQTNQLLNIRIKNNALYWQSSWSKNEYIWRLPLNNTAQTQTKQPLVELIKQGNLIWHFDVTPQNELRIAKMEALEGDIKRLSIKD
ncbi:winged helix-turn-helix domain-containing protein [Psychrobium sp. 1_MG-2023]|uniref:winged helix-turn-helix domain-containing protein n=1 Tax=Psychrobium sp. 1_MG-2023 TaxID=3062624 RepID=UPI002733CE2B|nr:winged helix-turn-helix domain-containing protein [Psychrobium sp. 1_MG-2023]MDP2561634.1 winged helix-turn-helix domain-containing protein [Psychrobium sp. 1_MG-2023]